MGISVSFSISLSIYLYIYLYVYIYIYIPNLPMATVTKERTMSHVPGEFPFPSALALQ